MRSSAPGRAGRPGALPPTPLTQKPHIHDIFSTPPQALAHSLRSLAALAGSKPKTSRDGDSSDGTAAAVTAALASLSDAALGVLRSGSALSPDQICGLAAG